MFGLAGLTSTVRVSGRMTRSMSARQTASSFPFRPWGMKPTVSRPQGTTPGAMLDTPPQPLYTRADVSLRTVAVSERRFLCVSHRL
jgi:hypothetical protein